MTLSYFHPPLTLCTSVCLVSCFGFLCSLPHLALGGGEYDTGAAAAAVATAAASVALLGEGFTWSGERWEGGGTVAPRRGLMRTQGFFSQTFPEGRVDCFLVKLSSRSGDIAYKHPQQRYQVPYTCRSWCHRRGWFLFTCVGTLHSVAER